MLSNFFLKTSLSLCSNPGPFYNHVINICAVVAFYSLILFKRLNSGRENRDRNDNDLRSMSITLFLLTGAYIAFLTPIVLFESCSPWTTTNKEPMSKGLRSILASW